ncbi:hypothetical protein [Avibacterium avium]|uniref:hypothetical protein n=1 Tax=Avibacterium avium TaxID=751 RepID=UPI0039FC311E
MHSINPILKNALYSYIDKIYAKFEKYDYALICDNGEDCLEIFDFDSNINHEKIAQFMIEKYGYDIYILQTKNLHNYILVFNSTHCANFKLNLTNISSLYENAEIIFPFISHDFQSLSNKFSVTELFSIQRIIPKAPSTLMGKWAKSLMMKEIEQKLETQK